jgi:hypothetical protein
MLPGWQTEVGVRGPAAESAASYHLGLGVCVALLNATAAVMTPYRALGAEHGGETRSG